VIEPQEAASVTKGVEAFLRAGAATSYGVPGVVGQMIVSLAILEIVDTARLFAEK
jgi:hypothetical protein